jgi:hypothetical protein
MPLSGAALSMMLVLGAGLQEPTERIVASRTATADECGVVVEALRRFRQNAPHMLIQDQKRDVIAIDKCAGVGATQWPLQSRLIIADMDTDKGTATVVFGMCNEWYLNLRRQDGSWFAEKPMYTDDACGELGVPLTSKPPKH